LVWHVIHTRRRGHHSRMVSAVAGEKSVVVSRPSLGRTIVVKGRLLIHVIHGVLISPLTMVVISRMFSSCAINIEPLKDLE